MVTICRKRFDGAAKTILIALSVFTALMSDGLAADAARSWRTDKMTLLDSKEFINATSRVLNGGIPGTGKAYDAQKVSDDLLDLVFGELKASPAVPVETALATLGALAGFAGQMAIREALIKPGKLPENKAFVVVQTKDGGTYYFGDALNEILFENKPGNFSIYALVAVAAQQSGAKALPDVKDIARYGAATVGSDAFGIPRVPAEHMPKNPPIELLDKFWNPVRNFLVVNVQSPLQWPLVLALAAQKVIIKEKGTVDPALAANLVMEAAIPMAKIDPAKIHFAYFQSY